MKKRIFFSYSFRLFICSEWQTSSPIPMSSIRTIRNHRLDEIDHDDDDDGVEDNQKEMQSLL